MLETIGYVRNKTIVAPTNYLESCQACYPVEYFLANSQYNLSAFSIKQSQIGKQAPYPDPQKPFQYPPMGKTLIESFQTGIYL